MIDVYTSPEDSSLRAPVLQLGMMLSFTIMGMDWNNSVHHLCL
jgi:hypothetical protein